MTGMGSVLTGLVSTVGKLTCSGSGILVIEIGDVLTTEIEIEIDRSPEESDSS